MYENQTDCIVGPKHGMEFFVLWHQCLNGLNLKNNLQMKYIKGSSKWFLTKYRAYLWGREKEEAQQVCMPLQNEEVQGGDSFEKWDVQNFRSTLTYRNTQFLQMYNFQTVCGICKRKKPKQVGLHYFLVFHWQQIHKILIDLLSCHRGMQTRDLLSISPSIHFLRIFYIPHASHECIQPPIQSQIVT